MVIKYLPAVLVSCAVIAAACSGGSDGGGGSTATADGDQSQVEAAAETADEPESAGTPQPTSDDGGDLTVGVTRLDSAASTTRGTYHTAGTNTHSPTAQARMSLRGVRLNAV